MCAAEAGAARKPTLETDCMTCAPGFVIVHDPKQPKKVTGKCDKGAPGKGLRRETCDQDAPNSGCLEPDLKCGKIDADAEKGIAPQSYCMDKMMCQSEPRGLKAAWCSATKLGSSFVTAVAVANLMM